MAGENNIIYQNVTDILESNYMPYAMSVIVSRAIPEIDGFKPAHRKLLYTMFKMGLLTGNRIKSADVVGQTMRLNPHGDGAIYETLVRLTRGNGALLHPFIDSKGNFGKQYSRYMAYAASRYTEVKLDSICEELFKDIDKNSVDFADNYNGRMKEPVLFPATFPNMLVTPNQGIAVGMASSICSFNLKEVCQATIQYIKNKNVDLLKIIKSPDFSTGGEVIYNEKEMRGIYDTGRGGFKVRARYRYDKKNSCVEVYEIPYTTTIEAIIDRIITLVKTNKLKDINDVRDETDLNGLKIAIDIKRNADPDLLMHRLFSMTTLCDSFNCNFNILVNGKPRVMGIKEILDEWLIFRIGCIKRRISFDIEKKEEKYHLLLGLSKILLDIDKAITIIRNTEDDSKVIPNLMERFGIDKPQAEFIAEIKLRNLNKEYLSGRVKETEGLRKEIEDLQELYDSEKMIRSLISSQLREVAAKHGKERRTGIIHIEEVAEIPSEAFIEDYGIKLFLTDHNYFKKIPLASLRMAGEQKLKDDDKIIQELETTNKSEILMFSDQCNVYKAKAYELTDLKASSMGEYLTNVLGLDDSEKIIFMTLACDYTGYMIYGFENGKFAKIPFSSYQTSRKKLTNAYSSKSKLIFIGFIEADKDFVSIRSDEKAILFNTSLVTETAAKNAVGLQAFTLKKDTVVTRICAKEDFVYGDLESYRVKKIPSAGRFIIPV